jgi:energy-coupling factor transport system permease protein
MRFAFHRDIGAGRYVPLPTFVHGLDPRTKLLVFAGILVLVFRVGLIGSAVLVAALLWIAHAARLPGRLVTGNLRALLWFFALTFLFQALWVGPTRLGGFGPGCVAGIWFVLRLAAMVLAASVLAFTTEPIRLADGLAELFGFLERVRVPVRDLALVLTLALRFLPTVMEEAQRIVTAQRARGADFAGGPLRLARALVPLAVPLFAACLRRADTLALAMEARGYRAGVVRTRLDPLAFGVRDAWALAVLAVALVLGFLPALRF